MELKTAFAQTLRETRTKRKLTQEDFSPVSSRTNISLLERGKTVPTLEKLDQISTLMEVHPLTLMAMCYAKRDSTSIACLLKLIGEEAAFFVDANGLASDSHEMR